MNNVINTLRLELSNGKEVLYLIDGANKEYLLDILSANSDGAYEGERISLLWFETVYVRQVIVNINSIARIVFGSEADVDGSAFLKYRDNFNVLEVEDSLDNLPQAIVYHKGNALLYSSLEAGCLAGFNLELEGEQPLRQFINLMDNNGEETFIPLEQIIVMEFDQSLLYTEDEETDEEVPGI